MVAVPTNAQPAALAHVRGDDGLYRAVCLTVLGLDDRGRIVELATFVLPAQFAAWGCPTTCRRERVRHTPRFRGGRDGRVGGERP